MTLWCGDERLVLASQSRARRMLLENAGLACEAVPADIDERALQSEAGLVAPYEIALHLAQAKARAVSAAKPNCYVVGADQTLALGERMFNKPAGRQQAMQQLLALAGRTHALHSAIAVVRNGEVLFSHVAVAWMTMRSLTESDVATYLDTAGQAVLSSVGAYQLEGLGVHLFDRIDGDHFTILGLPLLPLLAYFREARLLRF
ncbi:MULTISPECIES: Maf family protein [Bradyrhizobium]|jgi:septum formation protein|uniref:Nucleoside triphosphate pyrophosphatase n=1 Tax=Bradyrhizobium denitrificans TaxID=2734912 RepID=A0ABS5GHI9_9BRAD|nr:MULTISPECIES: Maf family protein [Bradyrhizobium]RTL93654.1 MAG: septum formation inhibitor Maf [Bradyrhizobiaceae bacterium]MBR1140561.1 Maf family protein [Bradyrhizobium denitrificans]MCL8486632.1 Maf family protein [Bradyrhizobium denitrificans]MDU1497024.1 Maf family protein [Bradyrhizobium sp.]MDU1547123.1 Maf family protein [Bradyrhizobium sp.]